MISLTLIPRKSNRWHLECIVAGILCGSVVAKIKIIYTLYCPTPGKYFTLSLSSRNTSTPLLLAASISITSLIVF